MKRCKRRSYFVGLWLISWVGVSDSAAQISAPIYALRDTRPMIVRNASGVLLDGMLVFGDELEVGDIDGDGMDEIVVRNNIIGWGIFGPGGVRERDANNLPVPSLGSQDDLILGDVNNNGKLEFIVLRKATPPGGSGFAEGELEIRDNNGALLNSFTMTFDGITEPLSARGLLASGDFDGDLKDEILIFTPLGVSSGIRIIDSSGFTISTFPLDLGIGQGFPIAITSGDIDDDGIDEIIVVDQFNQFGGSVIRILNLAGTEINSFECNCGGAQRVESISAGDVDGDGRDEITVGPNFRLFDGLTGSTLPFFAPDFALGSAYAIGTRPYPADSDGDGLFDFWEINGVNVDGIPGIDLDLPNIGGPGIGTDPNHKDLFLELDWMPNQMPTKADILSMKAAFAMAPVNAGGVLNPDGQRGITLWVDTGNLVIGEDGTIGTCNDGLDNGGDGLTDAADPDCRGIEGGGFRSCNDNLDNDGNGLTDLTLTPEPSCALGESNLGVQTCTDGVDNDGDGFIDGADTDCLVGDNLGGGNQISTTVICKLNSAFYTAKGINFNRAIRGLIFRYGISGNRQTCNGGGWGELGGNDFIDYNHDGGTIMHELGHTLNLGHGGDDSDNCKPNYVSIMNYDHQFGIRRVGGGRVLDFSPPRFPGSENGAGPGSCLDGVDNGGDGLTDAADPDCAGNALGGSGRGSVIGPLNEDSLSDGVVLDAGDPINRFAFTDARQIKRFPPLNQQVDWLRDGDLVDFNITPTFSIDMNSGGEDNAGIAPNTCIDGLDNGGDGLTDGGDPNCTLGGPPRGCMGNGSRKFLTGYNDWDNIVLNLRVFGDSSNGAFNPVMEPEPTLEELLELERFANSVDLAVALSALPDPVEAGDTLVYTMTIQNNGPNIASSARAVLSLPTEVEFVSDDAGCVEDPQRTLTCDVVAIPSGETREVRVTVRASDVCEAGVPLPFAASATVANLIGLDPDSDNNHTELTVDATDTTPPSIGTGPNDVTVECDSVPAPATLTATDKCDPDPGVVFAEVRTDGPCEDTYTLARTWTATDASGNSAQATQIIAVQDTKNAVLGGVPADVTVECDSVPAPANVTAADNCDPGPVLVFEEVRTDGPCDDTFTLTRTWTATDRCGHSTSASQTIAVEDTTDPVIGECPEDIFIECAPSAGLEIEFDTPGATDNCDGDVTVTADVPSGSLFASGEKPLTTVVTFTAEDNCGHTDSCSFEVTLVACGACCNFNGDCEDDVRHNTCFDDTPFTPLGRTWFVDSACADVVCEAIPTVSEWGLLVMTLLGCTAGTIIFGRRQRAAA